MPRFTLHRPASPSQSPKKKRSAGMGSQSKPESTPTLPAKKIPDGLRTDKRLRLLGELPQMLLIECPRQVAEEWLAQMPGWMLESESKAKIPDPRPKLEKPIKDPVEE